MGIALNMWVALDSMVILIISIIPIMNLRDLYIFCVTLNVLHKCFMFQSIGPSDSLVKYQLSSVQFSHSVTSDCL